MIWNFIDYCQIFAIVKFAHDLAFYSKSIESIGQHKPIIDLAYLFRINGLLFCIYQTFSACKWDLAFQTTSTNNPSLTFLPFVVSGSTLTGIFVVVPLEAVVGGSYFTQSDVALLGHISGSTCWPEKWFYINTVQVFI